MKRILSQFRYFRIGMNGRIQAPPTAFILSLPFPAVAAWSVWNEGKDEAVSRFTKSLRFVGSKEKQPLSKILYELDDAYKNGEPSEYPRVYEVLEALAKDNPEPEVSWRLARIKYELSKKPEYASERSNMLTEAYGLVNEALKLDDGNFAVHKWVAILLNEVSVLNGIKEQIVQSVNVKYHIMRAVELNPNDPTCRYMLGHWCFSVSEVPWYQKKLAATLFATPPESTYEEALEHFLNAEKLEPDFYSMNHLMLAKTYIHLGEPLKAAKYLRALENRLVRTDDDFKAKTEAIDLIKKHFKNQTHFEEAAA